MSLTARAASALLVGPSAHADFQGGTVSEPMAPERLEALFAGLKSLDVSDDRFRGDPFPMLDYPGHEKPRGR